MIVKTKLNMGCGFKKIPDYHNVDIADLFKPDEIVDLEKTPWPWADDTFEAIAAYDVLEHLGPSPREFIDILKEMYRVSKDQAVWTVRVPHWRCDIAVDDPTHVRVITTNTFKLFDQKKNKEGFEADLSHSLLGLTNGIDIEVEDTKFDFVGYWAQQARDGWIGARELDVKLNTLNNICESLEFTIRVHKPGRYLEWARKFI